MAASLLIAFDGSAAAEAAVRAAGALFPGARATVLTIHEPAISPMTTFRAGGALMAPELIERNLTELERELVAEAEAAAADGARLAEAAGLGAEPAVAPGERQPWEPILAAAAERDADVVVCGTRGRGPVARSVLGSTSSSLLHHADRAVLVVPEADVSPDGPALIAYDGSPAADEAIAAAGPAASGPDRARGPRVGVAAAPLGERSRAERRSGRRDPGGDRRLRDVAARGGRRPRSRTEWGWHERPDSRRAARPSSRARPPGGC